MTKSKESVIFEKKQFEDQIQKLVEDLERVKIINKELKSIKDVDHASIKTTPGDNYDHEDEVELDSERTILKGKHS